MIEVACVLLGWLLGTLSPLITRHGERRRRQKEIGDGLRAEVSELRVRIAMACYLITLRYGTFDRAFIAWLMPLFERYKGAHPAQLMLGNFKNMLQMSDDAIASIAHLDRANVDKSLGLKKYRLPYLEANLGNLDIFSERVKFLLIETAAQVEVINEEIDRVRYYHDLTFDSSVTETNHELARRSIAESSLNIERTSRRILEKLLELDLVIEE